ncbi:MAG: L-2-hydroxyglutarate oxidase [Bacteroidia bacterium]|nr:L-2-hydroxyglutarate oxidase [Bacteroidia bacterium]MCX7651516.1 L-2-hydroxyglutarate oxidase [Bacteroidia bacterium]MDW8416813.1 L-2-hydroxyglutarate oxidase [Bacteroidia bacterium]
MAYDITVIGAGVVGAAVAHRLRKVLPDVRLLVLEKEPKPAFHQSGRNSGVIHSGIYYKPGSLKATLCAKGREMLYEFAANENIPHDRCGKLILATESDELPRLHHLYERGLQNAIPGIKLLSAAEIQLYEPEARGVGAIHVPVTGIIDYKALTERLLALSLADIRYQTEVLKLRGHSQGYHIETTRGDYESSYVIACAGLQADRLARLDGLYPPLRVVPFRGDYYELRPEARWKVRHLIYPLPHPTYPVLGVHLTRMTDGSIEAGPNAVFAWAREVYSRTGFSLRDSIEALSFVGTWRFFLKHWREGWTEYRRAFSKRLFWRSLQRLVPSLTEEDLIPARSGIRALALTRDGRFWDDFYFVAQSRSLHVLNAPSPAATASLALAEVIVQKAIDTWQLSISVGTGGVSIHR